MMSKCSEALQQRCKTKIQAKVRLDFRSGKGLKSCVLKPKVSCKIVNMFDYNFESQIKNAGSLQDYKK